MNDRNQTVLRDLGLLIQIPGLMALSSLPICWFFHEEYALGTFLLTAFTSIGLGQLFYRLFREAKGARRREALQIVALSWIIIPLLGTIPYLAIASEAKATIPEFQSFWNALLSIKS